MTSNTAHNEAFVWVWLPEAHEPVIAGKLETDNGHIQFNYGKRYLERLNDTGRGSNKAISLYDAELPLRPGVLPLLDGLNMPGCIRDGLTLLLF